MDNSEQMDKVFRQLREQLTEEEFFNFLANIQHEENLEWLWRHLIQADIGEHLDCLIHTQETARKAYERHLKISLDISQQFLSSAKTFDEFIYRCETYQRDSGHYPYAEKFLVKQAIRQKVFFEKFVLDTDDLLSMADDYPDYAILATEEIFRHLSLLQRFFSSASVIAAFWDSLNTLCYVYQEAISSIHQYADYFFCKIANDGVWFEKFFPEGLLAFLNQYDYFANQLISHVQNLDASSLSDDAIEKISSALSQTQAETLEAPPVLPQYTETAEAGFFKPPPMVEVEEEPKKTSILLIPVNYTTVH